GAGRAGEISRRIQRLYAGRCLLRLRCIFQTRTRSDRGRLLDAREKVRLQSLGIGSATHGTGVASDRARLYAVEERAKALSLSVEQRLALRQRVSAGLLGKLHKYLLELQPEVLPKSPSGAAVRYALNQWAALT